MNRLDDQARRAAASVRHRLAEQPLRLPDELKLAHRPRHAAALITLVVLGAAGMAAWAAIGDDEQLALRTEADSGAVSSTPVTVSSAPLAEGLSSTTATSQAQTVTTVPVPTTALAKAWVGKIDPLAPGQPPGIVTDTRYAISFDPTYAMVRAIDGDREMLWFERHLSVAGKNAGALILDAVDLQPASDGQRPFLAVRCAIGDSIENPDPEIVAQLGPPTGEQTARGTTITTGIELAWRFNRQTERIEPLPTTGIVCPDNRYGG